MPSYFNPELSRLEFSLRVLEEAMDEGHPLLERVWFLSIFHVNLDEFFMVRIGDVGDAYGVARARVLALTATAERYWRERLQPEMAAAGICLLDYANLSASQKAALGRWFERMVCPALAPQVMGPGQPFPPIPNLSLGLAVALRDAAGEERLACVEIPAALPRFVPVAEACAHGRCFVWLEQLVAARLPTLFPGMTVGGGYPFRIVRDAHLDVREVEAGDPLEAVKDRLARRRFARVRRLDVDARMPQPLRVALGRGLDIRPAQVYPVVGPLGLSDLVHLHALDRPDLKFPPFHPRRPAGLGRAPDPFAAIRARDVLLHHPYDSFTPIVELVRRAAEDPAVLAIHQTIYRVGPASPVVDALAEASRNGKQVTAVVELTARFDEENNIAWARALERAGARVVYGDVARKTHVKALLIARQEAGGVRRYVHLSTGNYDERTARLYADLALLTSDENITEDVAALFNALTGGSRDATFRKLLVSPRGIRAGLMERIEREAEHARAGRGGCIVCKMNALTDLGCADALYRASQAGVKVDLIVRGSCVLTPGVPSLSENIRVVSIVGRFLEHSRVYYFGNGGEQSEVWLGSADMMERNLDRRVEVLFPLEDRRLRERVVRDVLEVCLRDTARARLLLPDGRYCRVQPPPGQRAFDSQAWLMARWDAPRGEPGAAK